MKKSTLMKMSILMKMSNLRKKSNLQKISKLRKMSNHKCSLHLPHLLPFFAFGITFLLDRKEICEIKRKQTGLWKSNNCDLVAELETWAASRWNFSFNSQSRWKWMNVDENGWKWMKVDKMDESGWKYLRSRFNSTCFASSISYP